MASSGSLSGAFKSASEISPKIMMNSTMVADNCASTNNTSSSDSSNSNNSSSKDSSMSSNNGSASNSHNRYFNNTNSRIYGSSGNTNSLSLRPRQRADLDAAILEYLEQGGYPKTADIFLQEAEVESGNSRSSNAGGAGNTNSKKGDSVNGVGILAAKWTSTTRQQLKITELEREISNLHQKLQLYQTASRYNTQPGGLPCSPPVCLLSGHRKTVNCVVFHPVFQLLATASEDATIKVWEYENEGRLERTLKNHTESVTDIVFNTAGEWLVSASADASIKIWDFLRYECLRTLNGHDGAVSSVKLCAEDGFLLSASRDKTIKVWNTATGHCIRTLAYHADWVRCIAVPPIPDLSLVASCSSDRSIHFYNWGSAGPPISEIPESHSHVVEFITFGNIQLIEHLLKNKIAPSPLPSIFTQPNTNQGGWPSGRVETARFGRRVSHRAAFSGCNRNSSSGNSSSGSRTLLDKCGLVLVSASRDLTIKLWNVADGSLIQSYLGHNNWIRSVEVVGEGRNLMSCSDDRSIRIWDVVAGNCIRVLSDVHEGFVTCLSSTDTVAASGSMDGKVKIWACKKELS